MPDPRLAALEKRKRIALLLLLTAGLGMAVFESLDAWEPHPGWSLGATVMEAALIGGLADWFAVVALFRHPLGQRWIPHTAIIPSKKDAIGRSLADFICDHFLGKEQVVEKLRGFDLAGRIAARLADPASAQRLGAALAEATPRLLRALGSQELHAFLHTAVQRQAGRFDLSHVAAAGLEHLTAHGRHEDLVDAALAYVRDALASEETRTMIAQRVSDELWSIVRMVRLDRIIVERITEKLVAGTTGLITEMASDRTHETRVRIGAEFRRLIERLKTDDSLRRNVEEIRDQLLARPELAEYLRGLWNDLVDWLERDLASGEPKVQARIATVAQAIGRQLAADEATRAWINSTVQSTVEPLIEGYREDVRRFIVDKVRQWSADELTRELELSIGSDLQYIRYNGTLVGGLIGAVLWAVMAGIGALVRSAAA